MPALALLTNPPAASGTQAQAQAVTAAATSTTAGASANHTASDNSASPGSFANALKRQMDAPTPPAAANVATSVASPGSGDKATELTAPPALSLAQLVQFMQSDAAAATLATADSSQPQSELPGSAATVAALTAQGTVRLNADTQATRADNDISLTAAQHEDVNPLTSTIRALANAQTQTTAIDKTPAIPRAQTDDHNATPDAAQLAAMSASLSAFMPPPQQTQQAQNGQTPLESKSANDDLAAPSRQIADPLAARVTTAKPEKDSSSLPSAAENSTAAATTPGTRKQNPAEFAAAAAASAANASTSDKTIEAARAEPRFEQALSLATATATATATAHAQAMVAHPHSEAQLNVSTSNTPPLKLETPVGQRGWDQEVGDKLVWMAGRNEQRAELVLTPPQLGRVEVTLHLKGDQATATFVTANPVTREALNDALPRLREVFADAGLSLGQAHVGADSGRNNQEYAASQRENRENSSRFSNTIEGISDGNISHLSVISHGVRQGRGLVDTFA